MVVVVVLRSFKIVKETTMNRIPDEQHHRTLHPRAERERKSDVKIIKHYVYLHLKLNLRVRCQEEDKYPSNVSPFEKNIIESVSLYCFKDDMSERRK